MPHCVYTGRAKSRTVLHRRVKRDALLTTRQGARSGASRTSFTVAEASQITRRVKTGAGRDRRATQPLAHFHRNPPGRGQLAVFPRCSLDPYDSDMGLRSRLEKQPTDLRQNTCYFGDRTLHCAWQAVISWRIRINVPNSSKRLSCLSNLEGAAEHATFKVGRSSGVAELDGCRRSVLALRK